MMDELKDATFAVLIVLAFVAVIGFIGWYTMEPEPVRAEIKQEVKPVKERYLHGARAL